MPLLPILYHVRLGSFLNPASLLSFLIWKGMILNYLPNSTAMLNETILGKWLAASLTDGKLSKCWLVLRQLICLLNCSDGSNLSLSHSILWGSHFPGRFPPQSTVQGSSSSFSMPIFLNSLSSSQKFPQYPHFFSMVFTSPHTISPETVPSTTWNCWRLWKGLPLGVK